MIRTKFDISLQIDDVNFKLVYKEASKQKAKEFKDKFADINKTYEELRDLSSSLEFHQKLLSLHEDLGESKNALNDLKKIQELKASLDELGKKNIDIDEIAKERFALLVSGEDSPKLMEFIQEHDITYFTLMEEIDFLVSKAKEKK